MDLTIAYLIKDSEFNNLRGLLCTDTDENLLYIPFKEITNYNYTNADIETNPSLKVVHKSSQTFLMLRESDYKGIMDMHPEGLLQFNTLVESIKRQRLLLLQVSSDK